MRARKGFSLVEVVVALLILTVMMLGAQALAGRMIRTSATASIQVTAAQLADDRIDYLRMDPQYDSLTARYVADENPVAGYGGYRRPTAVNRTITATTNGTHTVTAIARTAAGTTTSPGAAVTVANTSVPPATSHTPGTRRWRTTGTGTATTTTPRSGRSCGAGRER